VNTAYTVSQISKPQSFVITSSNADYVHVFSLTNKLPFF